MPKSIDAIVIELQALVSKDSPIRTFTWSEFMQLCDRKIWKTAFASSLRDEALEESLIVGYGNDTVILMIDAGLAPLPVETPIAFQYGASVDLTRPVTVEKNLALPEDGASIKIKWLRTHLATDEHDNANMTLDLLVDAEMLVVRRVIYCGWWGRVKSTDVLPITVFPDGKVDFGSDAETDQTDRYGFLHLSEARIALGNTIKFRCDDVTFDLKVRSFRDLTEGLG